jgi:hypothetical protein
MTYVALGVSGLALAFTIASFWWLYARTGSLEAAAPRSYAFADKVRLRLPFAFFNTGAKALIVTDLRLLVHDPDREPLEWITTRSKLRPDSQDGFAFATPFSVPGRGTKEVIAEFGNDHGWSPEPSSRHWIHLQARVHPSETWEDKSSRLTWCNALARRTGDSGWLAGAHLLWVGVALVLVDEHERERFG